MDAEYLQGFYLGDLLVEPLKGRVSGKNGEHHLPPKAAEVLVCLARHAGEIVPHERLLECAWGNGSGSRESLSHTISEIRHALDDHAGDPKYIQTLPRVGYRLIIDSVPSSNNTSQPPEASGKPRWWRALLRHGVVQAAAAYLVTGWVLIQVADTTFAKIGLPAWSEQLVTFGVIGGFPLVIIVAWCFEFVGGRMRHDRGQQSGRFLQGLEQNYLAIFIAFGIAMVGAGIYHVSIGFVDTSPPVKPVARAPNIAPIAENSIAVLPFLNNDGSEQTQVFANGLVDDVITRLSRVPGLLVASRGDAATLDPNSASARVRQRLRVAMYIEGSVEMEGDVIRVIVQLIDSSNGFHILSRTFDRPRRDFFEIRDEITQLTVASLRPALPEKTQVVTSSAEINPDIDAYILYRHGIEELDKPTSAQTLADALRWFGAALAIDPEYAAAHAGRCRAHVLAFREFDDPQSINDAEASCGMALELNPNLDIVHVALGDLHRKRGRYDEAEAAYLDTLRINPKNVLAMVGLSDVYLLLQRPDEAERILIAAIGLQPGNWSIYSHLGFLYSRLGQYGDAATQFRAVVEIDDRNMRGYSNLGGALMLAGRFEEAAPVYEKSLEIQPHANTYANLGLMHYYLGHYEEAATALRGGINLAPDEYTLWMNLGDILAAGDNRTASHDAFSHALGLAQQIASVNPHDPALATDLAWIHAMLSDEAEAARLIGRAAEGLPADPHVDFVRGLILCVSGDPDGAIRSLETAISKGYPRAIIAAEPHLLELHQYPGFVSLMNEGG